jgi:hypothetical protein
MELLYRLLPFLEPKQRYFIRKYEATRPDDWCIGTYDNALGQHCALGFLGFPDRMKLMDLFEKHDTTVVKVNDGRDTRFPQESPRARILAALHSFGE